MNEMKDKNSDNLAVLGGILNARFTLCRFFSFPHGLHFSFQKGGACGEKFNSNPVFSKRYF